MLIRHWLESLKTSLHCNLHDRTNNEHWRRQRFPSSRGVASRFLPFLKKRHAMSRQITARRYHWGARQRLA